MKSRAMLFLGSVVVFSILFLGCGGGGSGGGGDDGGGGVVDDGGDGDGGVDDGGDDGIDDGVDDDGGVDGDNDGNDENTDPPTVSDPVINTLEQADDPLAKAFGDTIALCGTQNHNTTPDDWGEVAVDGGNVLCSVWTPAFWNNSRTGLINVIYNENNQSQSVTIAGGTPAGFTVECTPSGVGDWAVELINAAGCTGARKVWSAPITLNVAGIGIPSEIFVVSCSRSGISQAGIYLAQVHGTFPLCSLRIDGYMTREDQIGADTCMLSQILNSLKCLKEGENNFQCTKPECSKNMIAQGYQGGFCNSFEECIPVQ